MASILFDPAQAANAPATVASAAPAAVAPARAAPAANVSADAVARIGQTQIGAAELAGFVRSLDPAVRKQAIADPNLMNRLVGLELARMALIAEAKAKKWPQRPEIASRMDRARDEIVVSTYLASVATPPKDYPSAAEIQSAYDLNRDKFLVPRQYRLEQIFVAAPADKNALAGAQKKVADLAAKTKARGADFEALARANSEHKPSAQRNGDMGWSPETNIVPEIRKEIAGMNRGDVSDPIRTPEGWHIVRMMDTRPAAPRPLAEVKDSIVQSLRQQKMQQLEQGYIGRVLEKSAVAVNPARLKQLFASSSP